MSVNASWNNDLSGGPGDVYIWRIADDGNTGQILRTSCTAPVNNLIYCEADSPLGLSSFGLSSLTGANNPFQLIQLVAANAVSQAANAQTNTASNSGGGSGSSTGTSVSANAVPGSLNAENMQAGGIVEPTPVPPNKPAPLSQPAMTTKVGMVGWLLAMVQNNPIILIGIAGVIVVIGYFGWWKQRL